MKEKSVTFTKGKSKFIENKQGEGEFSVQNLGLLLQSSRKVKQEISPEIERIKRLTNFLTT